MVVVMCTILNKVTKDPVGTQFFDSSSLAGAMKKANSWVRRNKLTAKEVNRVSDNSDTYIYWNVS